MEVKIDQTDCYCSKTVPQPKGTPQVAARFEECICYSSLDVNAKSKLTVSTKRLNISTQW